MNLFFEPKMKSTKYFKVRQERSNSVYKKPLELAEEEFKEEQKENTTKEVTKRSFSLLIIHESIEKNKKLSEDANINAIQPKVAYISIDKNKNQLIANKIVTCGKGQYTTVYRVNNQTQSKQQQQDNNQQHQEKQKQQEEKDNEEQVQVICEDFRKEMKKSRKKRLIDLSLVLEKIFLECQIHDIPIGCKASNPLLLRDYFKTLNFSVYVIQNFSSNFEQYINANKQFYEKLQAMTLFQQFLEYQKSKDLKYYLTKLQKNMHNIIENQNLIRIDANFIEHNAQTFYIEKNKQLINKEKLSPQEEQQLNLCYTHINVLIARLTLIFLYNRDYVEITIPFQGVNGYLSYSEISEKIKIDKQLEEFIDENKERFGGSKHSEVSLLIGLFDQIQEGTPLMNILLQEIENNLKNYEFVLTEASIEIGSLKQICIECQQILNKYDDGTLTRKLQKIIKQSFDNFNQQEIHLNKFSICLEIQNEISSSLMSIKEQLEQQEKEQNIIQQKDPQNQVNFLKQKKKPAGLFSVKMLKNRYNQQTMEKPNLILTPLEQILTKEYMIVVNCENTIRSTQSKTDFLNKKSDTLKKSETKQVELKVKQQEEKQQQREAIKQQKINEAKKQGQLQKQENLAKKAKEPQEYDSVKFDLENEGEDQPQFSQKSEECYPKVQVEDSNEASSENSQIQQQNQIVISQENQSIGTKSITSKTNSSKLRQENAKAIREQLKALYFEKI